MSTTNSRTALAAVVIALLIASCGSGEETAGAGTDTTAATTTTAGQSATSAPSTTAAPVPGSATQVPPTDYAGFAAQPTACGAEAPPPVQEMTFDTPEDQSLDPDTMVRVTVSTSCGDITLELDPSVAPETVNSFVFLARSGYFDGSVSHRIAPGFVVQAGDPTGTGRGGPGYTIADELPGEGFLYETGFLAMANAGPGTTGSQFFIVLADAPLPPDYTYFGKVADGFDTLEAIAQIPLGVNPFGEQSVPLETLYIQQVTVAE